MKVEFRLKNQEVVKAMFVAMYQRYGDKLIFIVEYADGSRSIVEQHPTEIDDRIVNALVIK